MPKVRVMLVDDHEVVRLGLRAALEPEADLEIVGDAGSAEEALRTVDLLRPDVVVMDVRMGGMSGIEACRAIKAAHPGIAVLILTSFGEQDAVMASIVAGASGYLLKNAARGDLLKAVRTTAAGQSLLDPAVTGKVLERFARLESSEQDRATEAISEREREVLALIAEGLTNRQIADRLFISENTARNHVSRILEKLSLTRRSEAASFATQHGLRRKQARPEEPVQ